MRPGESAFDAVDGKLLDLVQRGIPLAERPFAELGAVAGLTEAQVIERLRGLKDEWGVIRQISAIFDSKALGYETSLVAAKYRAEALGPGAAVIGAHPGVSHSYERSHEYNLWYTVAVGPDSKLGLQGTVERLHELSGATSTRLLPMLKRYKIGVHLMMSEEGETAAAQPGGRRVRVRAGELSETEIRLVRVLQQDLPIVAEPWVEGARQAEVGVADLLEGARRMLAGGPMRRFAAVLRHREAGFEANVMAVWRVDPRKADEVGGIFARYAAVSHCYLRPTYEDWPYNLYTMVHARQRAEAEGVLAAMQRDAGGAECAALWSIREFKKSRVRYFTGEMAKWEARHGAGGCC